MFKMAKNVDMNKYKSDVSFGMRNQEAVLKHLDLIFSAMLERNVEVKEFGKNSSRFDYYIPNEKILIELKSRRCTYDDYPTQIIGLNKVKSGRKKMELGYRIFFAFLLQNKKDKDKMDLFIMEDDIDNEYEIRELGNFKRNDKKSKCCVIRNENLTFIDTIFTSF